LFAYLTTDRRRWLLGFALTDAAALHCHHLAIVYQAMFSGILAFVMLQRYFKDRTSRDSGVSFMSVVGLFFGVHLLILALYLPTLTQFINYIVLSAPGERPIYTLELSATFFQELFGRWGNGTEWSMVYAVLLIAGVVHTMHRRDMTIALIVWLVVPFVLFANYPFAWIFDIRYVIGALPPFILLVTAGLVAAATSATRIIENRLQLRSEFGPRI